MTLATKLQAVYDAAPRDVGFIREKPLVIFVGQTKSFVIWHLAEAIRLGANVIAIVTANPAFIKASASLKHIKTMLPEELIAAPIKGAVLINYETQHTAYSFFGFLAKATKMYACDKAALLAAYNLHVILNHTAVDFHDQTRDSFGEFIEAADLLADEASKETLYATMLMRLQYERNWMLEFHQGKRDEYFCPHSFGGPAVFTLTRSEHFVDCGANVGWIVDKLIGATANKYGSLTLIEPDPTAFATLQRKFKRLGNGNVRLMNIGVSDIEGTVEFKSFAGGTGSHVNTTTSNHPVEGTLITVPVRKLDDICSVATFIKMDIEGFEYNALLGAEELIRAHKPRLAISAYHNPIDLARIPKLIKSFNSDYKIELKNHSDFYYGSCIYAS